MALIAEWNGYGASWAAQSEDANVSAGSVAAGASLYDLLLEAISAPDYAFGAYSTATGAAEAVTENQYFSVTVTADAGYELDLSSLNFDAARGGSSTPRGYVVRSSVDGYASNIASADIGTAYPTWTPVSIDLTGASYQNLAGITFRIYAYAPGTSYTVAFDNIEINGSVVATGEPPSGRIMTLNRKIW